MSNQSPNTPSGRDTFVTTDMGEAQDFLDRAYGWRINVHRPNRTGHPLVVSQNTASQVTMAHATAPGELSYDVTGGDYVVFDTLFSGTFELDHGRHAEHYQAGDVFVANDPGADFTARTHEIDVLTTTIPSSLFTEVAGTDPDEGPVAFHSYNPLAGKGHRWRSVSRFVDRLLNDPNTSSAPLVVGPAARLLTATALESFPNNLTGPEQLHDRTDAGSAVLHTATTFIDAHAATDITLTDIAAAANVTTRAVQYAFRRHLGTTPMAYLRDVRLEAAHHDLATTDPATTTSPPRPARDTVTAVATRWGFAHPGRFATLYRRTHGQAPSTTLHS